MGYDLDFDMAVIGNYLRPFAVIELPNPLIEEPTLYYDRKYSNAPPGFM